MNLSPESSTFVRSGSPIGISATATADFAYDDSKVVTYDFGVEYSWWDC